MFTLPGGAAWRPLGGPPGTAGYKYVDADGVNGPCSLLIARPGSLSALCRGRLGTIPFSLDEPTQGALLMSVQLGAAEVQCALFGGNVVKDAGTANPGPRGSFDARKAPAGTGVCP